MNKLKVAGVMFLVLLSWIVIFYGVGIIIGFIFYGIALNFFMIENLMIENLIIDSVKLILWIIISIVGIIITIKIWLIPMKLASTKLKRWISEKSIRRISYIYICSVICFSVIMIVVELLNI